MSKKGASAKDADKKRGKGMDQTSPKLPPLPTFQRVRKTPAMKQEKTAKPSKKASAKRVRTKGKSTQSTTSQVSGFESQISDSASQVSGFESQVSSSSSAASHQPLHHAVVAQREGGSPTDAHRAPLQTQPDSTSIHSPVSGFGSQISESAPQVSALRSPVSAAPATATEPAPSEIAQQVATLSEQVSALRDQLSTLDSRPSTSASSPPSAISYSSSAAKPPAAPPLIYELKETQPIGSAPANLQDSTTDELLKHLIPCLLGVFHRSPVCNSEELPNLDLQPIISNQNQIWRAMLASLCFVQNSDKKNAQTFFRYAINSGFDKKTAAYFLYHGAKSNLMYAKKIKDQHSTNSLSIPFIRKQRSQKIFCIGANKTGTTSMYYNLKKLGYSLPNQQFQEKSTVFPFFKGDYAPLLSLCDKFDAFQDMPFSYGNTYCILDCFFPESKFILTIRKSDEWFNSLVSFHKKTILLKAGVNDLNNLSKNDFINKNIYLFKNYIYKIFTMHSFVYRKEKIYQDWNSIYDKNKRISEYEMRNKNIMAHFAERKNQLLVIDLSKEKNNYKLLRFLGRGGESVQEMCHRNITSEIKKT